MSPLPPPPTQRGVALGLFASDPAYDYGPLLAEIKATGATDVLISVVWAQPRIDSAHIRRSDLPSTLTAADATVLRTLLQARKQGLRVTLFPIVRLEQHTAKEWRGRIAPTAGVDAWFSSYGEFMNVMADLATRGGAARLSVGSEFLSLEHHESKWRALIVEVRQRFSGGLLYSANWDHYERVPFWDALDEIGVTAYFELASDPHSVGVGVGVGVGVDVAVADAQMRAAWEGPRRELLAFAQRVGKPLVVSEVGYPSRSTAAWHPWDETASGDLDFELQTRLYRVFCDSWKHSGVAGFYFWNWFGFGGFNDGGYTPRGKPAAAEMTRCLADSAWAGGSRGTKNP